MAELPFVPTFRLLGFAAALVLAVCRGGQTAAQPPGLPSAGQPADLSASPVVQPTGQETVAEVRIVGNRTIPREKILPHIYTRAGRPFDVRLIEEDVRRLNRSGMFVQVRPLTQRVPGGRVVIYEVLERPILLEVKYVGNSRVTRKVLQEQTGLKVGDALDPFEIEEGRRKIEEYYHTKGFGKVRVTVLEGTKPTDRRAIYLINEGPRQKVVWTSFVGNTIASDARLRTQIKSKPPILYLFKGDLNREQLDEDVRRLTAYYRGLGFFRARIGREIEFSQSQNWVWVTFVIDEGPRYRVRNVSFIGNSKFPTEKLAEKVTLRGGEYFNQAQLNADLGAIREEYGSVGYIFADVKAEPRFLDEPGVLDLVYDVREGDRYRVGRINVEIKGDVPHTRLSTVLNRISLKPGDIVDIRELRASERRLRASGLFLVDPAAGIVPKIVYSPPELDEETELARRPRHRVNFRGQSPDDGYRRVYSTPRAALPAAVPVVDLTLRGEVGAARVAAAQVGMARVGATQAAAHTPVTTPASARSRAPAPVPMSGPAPRRVWQPGSASPGRRVVRGQDAYDPNTGRSLPPLRRNSSPRIAAAPGAPGAYGDYGNYNYGAPAEGPVPRPSSGVPGAYPGTTTGAGVDAGAGAGVGTGGVGATGLGIAEGAAVAPEPRVLPGQMPPNGPIFAPNSPFAQSFDESARDIDLLAQVHETHTGRLMLGVGINSDAGLIGSFVIDEQNFDWTRFPRSWQDIRMGTAFRGAGQRFRLEAVPGTEVQRYLVSFQDPYLMRTNVSLSLSGFYYDRRYLEWDENRLGGRTALGYHFTPSLSGSFTFRGERVNVYNPIVPPGLVQELDDVVGDNALYGFGVSLTHDTRDSPFLATEGHLIQATFEQVIGSFVYPRGDIELRKYFLLHQRPDGSGRHVLSFSGRLGVTGSDTPIYDHYFAGGFSTLRGYDFRGASPVSRGIRIGGDFMMLASAEYMFPITADDTLRAVVFCDTGTVEPTINNWNQRYRVAPGVGLRILIPAMGPAPIALDFAFPMSSDPTDDEEMFSFFLGVLR